MKIIMIGPFPPPINGMSLANQMLKEGLSIGLGIYLATMIGIVIYFIRKKRLFSLIPISTLIVGLGGSFLVSFEHMFFIVVFMLLQSRQCLTTNKTNILRAR